MCANEPLHFAARFGYIEIAEMLLIKERSAAYKGDIDGDTALHVAAAHGRVDNICESLFLAVRAVVNWLITEDGMFFTMPRQAKIETQSDLFCKIYHLETL
ncbi:hypothetical protein LWI29_000247 [Acer saccharum]|uniref:Uncharacterized protein n=1 Tax=Acer saccharum TaxID=4024 RepID=A0AA39SZR8_ACESA|nr:hypothetical protein LWI29_000247 [Acer saccharum]